MTRKASASSSNDTLAAHGGLVLVLTGGALIVLAAVLSTRAAAAPIFAFTGFAAVVLGVLLPRIRGPVEISINKIKLVLEDTKRQIGAQRLSTEEVGEVLEDALARIEGALSREGYEKAGRSEEPAPTQPTSAEDVPTQAIGPRSRLSPLAAAVELEDRVGRWLAENGWAVTRPDTPRASYDFQAARGQERIVVEVKARRIAAADIAAIADLLPDLALDVPNVVLVTPEASLSDFALAQANAAADVLTVYEAREDGTFRRIAGSVVVEVD